MIIVIGLGLGIWVLGFWLGGCASTQQEIVATTTTTTTTGTTTTTSTSTSTTTTTLILPGIYLVDTDGDVGQYSSIAVDSHNHIHISYSDFTNSVLKYATNSSGNWAVATIDLRYNGMGNGKLDYTSIVVDKNNKIHISYHDANQGSLMYASNTSGSWETETILDFGGAIGCDAIALDGNNHPYVSFYGIGAYALILDMARNIYGTWQIHSADGYPKSDSKDLGQYNSIATGNNKINISYYDAANGHLKYVWADINDNTPWISDSGWNISVVDDGAGTANVGQYSSIALDANGYVYIAYYDATNGNLKYASNKTGVWSDAIVDSTGDVGKYASIKVRNQKMYISYYDATNRNLKCAIFSY